MRTRTYSNAMRDFATLANAVNRNAGRFGSPYDYASNGGSNERTKLTLPVDIWTTDNAYHIATYLPGVDPDAVEITFEADKLTIRGELPNLHQEQVSETGEEGDDESAKGTQPENSDVKYIRRELFHGSFERTLNFNVPVVADNITATFKHGVLTLVVPKAEEILPKQIKVNVA